jgi:anti-sigma regulatory factor (Ser/Thr protein kinase)
MSAVEYRVFQARLAMLAQTVAFVEDFCRRHAVVHDDAMRLTLIVEELFSNTVVHGHRGDCDAQIAITLAAAPGEVSLLYEDGAPRFDPLAAHALARHRVAAGVEERPVGGLGVLLIMELCRDAHYAHEDGRKASYRARAFCIATRAPL